MKILKSSGSLSQPKRRKRVYLYLLNDEYNTIEYVMRCLMTSLPLCNSLRAEQLAMIAHNNGECLIYSTLSTNIYIIYAQLQKLGLEVDIRYSKTKY